jgi:uncharacterized oxidoreductase
MFPLPLTESVERLFHAAGTRAELARQVAVNLVEANLKGHDSHGVGMAPRYVQAIAAGGLQPNAAAGKAVTDQGGIIVIDGLMGYGQVVGSEAIGRLAARARGLGLAMLGLRNVHHLGRIGAYAEQLAAAGLVSMHFVNVSSSVLVAPWHGLKARFGTNPVCIGLPAPGGDHVILDFATSRLAQGKVRVAWLKGEPVPGGPAMVDAEGRLTDDPAVMFTEPRGALIPFGEHKGAGLALACSLLTGPLIGGVTEQTSEHGVPIVNGMMSIAIDPAAMGAGQTLRDEIEPFVAWVKEAAAPGRQVKAPGQAERESQALRGREGIPLDDGTLGQLRDAARSVGLDPETLFPAA